MKINRGPQSTAGRIEQLTLKERLRHREFEFGLSMKQLIYYWLERRICHLLLRRCPPKVPGPNTLNLGCGPHIFPGWVNADDYAVKRRFQERGFRPNWKLDITRKWRCPDSHWDGVFTEHVIEHVTYSEAVAVFEECLRTLKSGAWIRISVPDVGKYARYYCWERPAANFSDFPEPALAISFVTQMHMHRSTWDAALMTRVLTEVGFVDSRPVSFGIGSDPRLIRDDADKRHESLYVEARKP